MQEALKKNEEHQQYAKGGVAGWDGKAILLLLS